MSPNRGTHYFGIKGKLAQRFVGPFHILETRGPLDFLLELPESLAMVRDVVRVSQLKQCVKQPEQAFDLGEIQLSTDLSYSERPVHVLETSERKTHNKTVKFIRCIRHTTRRRKQRGSVKIISVPSIPSCFILRSRDEIQCW